MFSLIGIEPGAAAGKRFKIVDAKRFSLFADTVARFGAELRPAPAPAKGKGKSDHERVCAVFEAMSACAGARADAQTFLFVDKCREFGGHLAATAAAADVNAPASWRKDGVVGATPDNVAIAADEIAQHMLFFSTPQAVYQSMAAHTERAVDAVLPAEIAALRQEANLSLIYPWFERALSVPGDLCEFGCFRGILSVKLAWFLKAAGQDKRYYTFDTFEGFEIDDPGGGVLGVGSFRDDAFDAFRYLTKWSKVLPLVPVKGDATKTVATLDKPLSFVWLDLDMAVLMQPVAQHIWSLCGPDTLIGVDDVGRPETPTVKPWLDKLFASGALEMVFDSDEAAPNTFIRFAKKRGPLPAA